MRQCECGGIIRQHQLTGDREAWTCGGCGRYEAIARSAPTPNTLDYAMREYADAAHALKAAVERAGQALAGVQAAIAIEKGRRG